MVKMNVDPAVPESPKIVVPIFFSKNGKKSLKFYQKCHFQKIFGKNTPAIIRRYVLP